MWSHPDVSSFKATSNLSEEEMEAFWSPCFFLPIGEKAIILLALSTLEDPSIQALLLLYECLSKGAETTLYHGWWMLVEDTKHHSSLWNRPPTKNGKKTPTSLGSLTWYWFLNGWLNQLIMNGTQILDRLFVALEVDGKLLKLQDQCLRLRRKYFQAQGGGKHGMGRIYHEPPKPWKIQVWPTKNQVIYHKHHKKMEVLGAHGIYVYIYIYL